MKLTQALVLISILFLSKTHDKTNAEALEPFGVQIYTFGSEESEYQLNPRILPISIMDSNVLEFQTHYTNATSLGFPVWWRIPKKLDPGCPFINTCSLRESCSLYEMRFGLTFRIWTSPYHSQFKRYIWMPYKYCEDGLLRYSNGTLARGYGYFENISTNDLPQNEQLSNDSFPQLCKNECRFGIISKDPVQNSLKQNLMDTLKSSSYYVFPRVLSPFQPNLVGGDGVNERQYPYFILRLGKHFGGDTIVPSINMQITIKKKFLASEIFPFTRIEFLDAQQTFKPPKCSGINGENLSTYRYNIVERKYGAECLTNVCNDNTNTFQCEDKRKCIPIENKCDSLPDCEDGSDEKEKNCPPRLSCNFIPGKNTNGLCNYELLSSSILTSEKDHTIDKKLVVFNTSQAPLSYSLKFTVLKSDSGVRELRNGTFWQVSNSRTILTRNLNDLEFRAPKGRVCISFWTYLEARKVSTYEDIALIIEAIRPKLGKGGGSIGQVLTSETLDFSVGWQRVDFEANLGSDPDSNLGPVFQLSFSVKYTAYARDIESVKIIMNSHDFSVYLDDINDKNGNCAFDIGNLDCSFEATACGWRNVAPDTGRLVNMQSKTKENAKYISWERSTMPNNLLSPATDATNRPMSSGWVQSYQNISTGQAMVLNLGENNDKYIVSELRSEPFPAIQINHPLARIQIPEKRNWYKLFFWYKGIWEPQASDKAVRGGDKILAFNYYCVLRTGIPDRVIIHEWYNNNKVKLNITYCGNYTTEELGCFPKLDPLIKPGWSLKEVDLGQCDVMSSIGFHLSPSEQAKLSQFGLDDIQFSQIHGHYLSTNELRERRFNYDSILRRYLAQPTVPPVFKRGTRVIVIVLIVLVATLIPLAIFMGYKVAKRGRTACRRPQCAGCASPSSSQCQACATCACCPDPCVLACAKACPCLRGRYVGLEMRQANQGIRASNTQLIDESIADDEIFTLD